LRYKYMIAAAEILLLAVLVLALLQKVIREPSVRFRKRPLSFRWREAFLAARFIIPWTAATRRWIRRSMRSRFP